MLYLFISRKFIYLCCIEKVKKFINLFLMLLLFKFLSHRPLRSFHFLSFFKKFLCVFISFFLIFFLLFIFIGFIKLPQVCSCKLSRSGWDLIIKYVQHLGCCLIVFIFHFFSPFSIILCNFSYLLKLLFIFLFFFIEIYFVFVLFLFKLLQPFFMLVQNSFWVL